MNMRRDWLHRLLKNVWTPFVVALVLHIALVLVLGHYKHPLRWENGAIADSIQEGSGFAYENGRLTSVQAPGYPYLLAIVESLCGKTAGGYLAISIVQSVLLASIVFPAGWLTRRWFGEDIAVICRWLVCFMPLYAWYATRIHQPALLMTLHPWLLYGWLTLVENKRVGQVIAVGALTGLCGLFQPVSLSVYGLLSGALLLSNLVSGNGRAVWLVFVAGVITLLMLTPWTIRNYQVHHRFIPLKDTFGMEFWKGNNPYSEGSPYMNNGADEIMTICQPRIMKDGLVHSEYDVMEGMRKEAWAYCQEYPERFVIRTAMKATYFWTFFPTRFTRAYGEGEARTYRVLINGYWVLFLTLTLVAVCSYRAWSKEYLWVFALYAFCYTMTYSLAVVGQVRYRGEIEFLILPAVAVGIYVIGQSITRWLQESKAA